VRTFPRGVGFAVIGVVTIASGACGAAGAPPIAPPAPPSRPSAVVPAQPRGAGTVVQPTPPRPTAVERPFSPLRPKQRSAANKPKGSAPPDHIVVVILENKYRSSVIGSGHAPYLNKLADRGASMSRSYGVTHPSQPNYLALFSGSTQGVTSDACPQNLGKADNLGRQLRKSGRTFVGYAESLPRTGFRGCESGRYLRKHNPWVDFDTLPASTNRPLTEFPGDYSKLPTVAFVSPNMCHDMHDCSIRTGDDWMKTHFSRYARWAPRNNSWLIVTFDENEGGSAQSIPTIILGPTVRPGVYAERLDHYSLLRTIEDRYGLPALGRARAESPVTKIFSR
jgi:hypothetical protein